MPIELCQRLIFISRRHVVDISDNDTVELSDAQSNAFDAFVRTVLASADENYCNPAHSNLLEAHTRQLKKEQLDATTLDLISTNVVHGRHRSRGYAVASDGKRSFISGGQERHWRGFSPCLCRRDTRPATPCARRRLRESNLHMRCSGWAGQQSAVPDASCAQCRGAGGQRTECR